MYQRLMLFVVAAIGLFVMPATLSAWPMQEQFPPNRNVCYERIYDNTYLAKHPKQKVTRITLIFEAERQNELNKEDRDKHLSMHIDFEVRGEEETYTFWGFCQEATQGILCVPGMGKGKFSVIAEKDGALLVNNHNMIVNPSTYAAEDIAPNAIRLKGDDKAWRLSAGGKHCGGAAKGKDNEITIPNSR